jgi:type IV pilus assembly protein PilN
MIRINLLPVRAAQKRMGAKKEVTMLALILGGLVVLLYVGHLAMLVRISDAEERVDNVKTQIAGLKRDVVRISDFKSQTEVLEKKIGVIEQLQKQKIGPAHMLDDLATILTDEKKVWLVHLEEKGGVLSLEGEAMEHENISDFQIALERRSVFFKDIKLVYVNEDNSGGVPHLKWKISCATNYAAG